MEPSRPILNLITRFRKISFDDFFIFGAYGPLGLGLPWGPLAGPRPGLALGWTLGAPKFVFEQPSITLPTFGTRYRIYGSGVKNCASEPTFHTRRGPG